MCWDLKFCCIRIKSLMSWGHWDSWLALSPITPRFSPFIPSCYLSISLLLSISYVCVCFYHHIEYSPFMWYHSLISQYFCSVPIILPFSKSTGTMDTHMCTWNWLKDNHHDVFSLQSLQVYVTWYFTIFLSTFMCMYEVWRNIFCWRGGRREFSCP